MNLAERILHSKFIILHFLKTSIDLTKYILAKNLNFDSLPTISMFTTKLDLSHPLYVTVWMYIVGKI